MTFRAICFGYGFTLAALIAFAPRWLVFAFVVVPLLLIVGAFIGVCAALFRRGSPM